MTKLAKAIERVGGYMTDAEVQEAFGVMLDALEDRSGAIRRQAAQLESTWSEIERLRAAGDAMERERDNLQAQVIILQNTVEAREQSLAKLHEAYELLRYAARQGISDKEASDDRN